MRAQAKLARQRERLFEMGPGGGPSRPIEVQSASVVEVSAMSTPCPTCGGALRVEAHDATVVDGASLRVARMRCAQCAKAKSIYFRIAAPN